MEKFDNVLFFGAFNPLHNGHLSVIEILRRIANRVDIYVGNSDRSGGRLSYITRLRLANYAIGGMDNCFISEAGKLEEIDENGYSAIALGSDLLQLRRNYGLPDKPFSTRQWDMIRRFSHVVLFNRDGHLIGETEKNYINEFKASTVLTSGSALSGRDLRKRFCLGEDISNDLPPGIFDMIKEEAEANWKK